MRPVALLTDFGHADHYVGVLHAVIERDAPGAVMAVVDPGVGTGRRAVAVTIGGRSLVAPDNGIAAAVPEASAAVALDWHRMGLNQPSKTFHGRDLFAPAAARLACGAGARDLGEEIETDALVACPLPDPVIKNTEIDGVVLHVDGFGNLVTNVRGEDVESSATATWRAGRSSRRVATYGEAHPDEVVLIEGSAGYLELAVNCGSAADATGLERRDTVVFSTNKE
jgi:S-adenosylmethionine hydrolase